MIPSPSGPDPSPACYTRELRQSPVRGRALALLPAYIHAQPDSGVFYYDYYPIQKNTRRTSARSIPSLTTITPYRRIREADDIMTRYGDNRT